MKTSRRLVLTVCVALLAGSGCVARGKYDQAVARVETTRAELERTNARLAQDAKYLDDMQRALARDRDETDQLKSELAMLEKASTNRSVEDRSHIASLQKRLEELQAAQRVAEARAALYKDLTTRLRKQIDAGDLAVVIRDGRMVLQLPNDVLFDSGRTELKPAGKAALEAVAQVIISLPERRFQISGHTDNVPIHNDRFASNWELSAGRALRVVHFLIDNGVPGPLLSAAGYSETDPLAVNDTPAGRQQNRRTEIALQPNIDEIVKVP